MDFKVPHPRRSAGDSLQRLKAGQTFIEITAPGETTQAEAAWLNQHLLSAEEREAAGRFRSARDQHEYIVAHSLVRLGLSACFPVAPSAWCFGRDPGNRPFIIAPQGLLPFQFSLSHTQGLAALLITVAPHAGVDVEHIKKTDDLRLVAAKILAPIELASLNQLADAAWVKRFFELWTLKEAYAKARGLGLALPLKSIAFKTDAANQWSVQFAPEIKDQPQDWQFWLRPVSPDYVLAAALRVKSGSPPAKIFFRTSRIGASANGGWLEPLRAET